MQQLSRPTVPVQFHHVEHPTIRRRFTWVDSPRQRIIRLVDDCLGKAQSPKKNINAAWKRSAIAASVKKVRCAPNWIRFDHSIPTSATHFTLRVGLVVFSCAPVH
jgi:hypothetical protein